MAIKYPINVRDIGGSRVITIPYPLARTEGIEPGDIVEVTLKVIRKGQAKKK